MGSAAGGRSGMERRGQVGIGAGITAAVLAGLIGWFLTDSVGTTVVLSLLLGVGVWLWFRRL